MLQVLLYLQIEAAVLLFKPKRVLPSRDNLEKSRKCTESAFAGRKMKLAPENQARNDPML